MQYTALTFSALLAVAAAAPFEKREYTTTIIEDVTSTVDVYTTIYVSPGDPRLSLNQQAVAQTAASAPAVSVTPIVSSSTPTQTPSQAPIAQPPQKEVAQVQAPAPTSTPVPSVTPQAPAQPEVKAPAPVAPAPVQSSAAPAPPAPIQSSPAPASSQAPSPGSSSGSGPSGGSCGDIMGKCTAGDVTTFDGSGAAGACGEIDPNVTPDYVAITVGMMGAQSNGGGSKNPYCDRKIKIKNNGIEYDAMVTDKCMGCNGGDQSLDLSPSLFAKIFDGATTGNFHNIDWWFTS
ncbi:hypothetical protein ACLMJK_007261 [Lecanora helva]